MGTKTMLFTVKPRPPSSTTARTAQTWVMVPFAFSLLVGFLQVSLSPSSGKMTRVLFGPDLWRQDGVLRKPQAQLPSLGLCQPPTGWLSGSKGVGLMTRAMGGCFRHRP